MGMRKVFFGIHGAQKVSEKADTAAEAPLQNPNSAPKTCSMTVSFDKGYMQYAGNHDTFHNFPHIIEMLLNVPLSHCYIFCHFPLHILPLLAIYFAILSH